LTGWKRFGLYALASIGGPLAVGAINRAASAVGRKVTEKPRFEKMMKTNPDLRELDQGQVRAAFGTLHRAAPDLSADPLVAGNFIRHQGRHRELIDPSVVGSLIHTQRQLQQFQQGNALIPAINTGFGDAAVSALPPDVGRIRAETTAREEAVQEVQQNFRPSLQQLQDESHAKAVGQEVARKAFAPTLAEVEDESRARAVGQSEGERISFHPGVARQMAEAREAGKIRAQQKGVVEGIKSGLTSQEAGAVELGKLHVRARSPEYIESAAKAQAYGTALGKAEADPNLELVEKSSSAKIAELGTKGKALLAAAALLGVGGGAGITGHHIGKKKGTKAGLTTGRKQGVAAGTAYGLRHGYVRGLSRGYDVGFRQAVKKVREYRAKKGSSSS